MQGDVGWGADGVARTRDLKAQTTPVQGTDDEFTQDLAFTARSLLGYSLDGAVPHPTSAAVSFTPPFSPLPFSNLGENSQCSAIA